MIPIRFWPAVLSEHLRRRVRKWLQVDHLYRDIEIRFVEPKPFVIPEGATLVISLLSPVEDYELAHIREYVKEFFEGHKVAIVQSNAVEFSVVTTEAETK